MDKLIAYAVLGVALYKIFWDKSNVPKSDAQPTQEGSPTQEPKMNMIGFSNNVDRGVNGVNFDSNMNFFD